MSYYIRIYKYVYNEIENGVLGLIMCLK